jgi:general secretion pathway protein A
MYLIHYNLAKHPFSISPDPEFLWLSANHKKAVSVLKYGFLEDKGFLALTGDVGTGKTLLVRNLVRSIPASSIIVDVPDPDMKPMEFFRYLAEEAGMQPKFKGKGTFQIQLKQFLLEAFGSDKKVLLIIDEAQRLNPKLLEQIRLLSNLHADKQKLINIFLVGQDEFDQLLEDKRCKATRQRITVRYHLEPFSENETFAYIQHRLKIAGSSRDLFSPAAIRKIHAYSKGYPRSINVLCDHALMLGCGAGLQSIDAEAVDESRTKLALEPRADRIKKNKPEVRQLIIDAPQPAQTHPPEKALRNRSAAMLPRSLFRPASLLVIIILIALTGYYLGDGNARNSNYRESRPATHLFQPDERVTEFGHRREDEGMVSESEEVPPLTAAEPAGLGPTMNASNQKMQTPAPIPLENTANPTSNLSVDQADPFERVVRDEADGLMPAGPPIEAKRLIVYFDTGSVHPPEDSLTALDQIVDQIRTYPQSTILIEGHSDSFGDADFNQKLSKFRAMTIKSYMIGRGIAPSKIQVSAVGTENPIESNATRAGREKNRRVEIKLYVRN